MKEARGQLASQVLEMVRRREILASELVRVDAELDTIRRALVGGPTSTFLQPRECVVCHTVFQPKRSDQSRCAGCARHEPSRTPVQVQDKQARGAIVESPCKGYDGFVCAKTVKRLANRRGPLRCPDCQLAKKRSSVRASLAKTRRVPIEPRTAVCRGCGVDFEIKPGRAGAYCSAECYQNKDRDTRSRNASKPAAGAPPAAVAPAATSWHVSATKRGGDPEMETVWNGGDGLTSVGRES